MFQKIILFLLAWIAKTIVYVHKPIVIGVTGTVGKSTITTHIAKFLISVYGKKQVAYSEYHYNGEYGLPLTIIGKKTGGKNPLLWIWIFLCGIIKIWKPFPKYLVLEYGIDHPGEMDYLLSIALPDIAILCEVAPNHLEQFGTFEKYRDEKLKITHKPELLIVHSSLSQYINREFICYGIGAMADIDVSHVEIGDYGTKAQINIHKESYQVTLPAFGLFHIENILPLVLISREFLIDSKKIHEYLKNFQVEAGRSALLRGINNSTIIDGSYNGGYLSIREGIRALTPLFAHKKVILLIGDMRELGDETEKMHKLLAQDMNTLIPPLSYPQLFFVGPYTKKYLIPELKSSFDVYHSLDAREAGKRVKELLTKQEFESSIIFVKGSQNTIYLEEAIKYFLEPSLPHTTLCRQSREWQAKKQAFFDSLYKK